MLARNFQRAIQNTNISARFLSTGANVTVVPEVTYVQNGDVLGKTGSNSFLGRVVAVGDKERLLIHHEAAWREQFRRAAAWPAHRRASR